MPHVVEAPPSTPIKPVTEALHGVEIVDPYRWLEDQNSPETRGWIEEQTTYTRAYFDSVPGRERIRKRVEELLAIEVVSKPWKVGDCCFFLKRGSHQEQSAIMMREWKSAKDIPLIDPAERGEGEGTAVDILAVSDDASVLAYSVRREGCDAYSVEFFDVKGKKILPDRLREGFCGGLSFSGDRKSFYYVHLPLEAPQLYCRAVCWHQLGTRTEEDTTIFAAGEEPALQLYMLASPKSRYLAYLVTRLQDPLLTDLYLQDPVRDKSARRIAMGMTGVFCPYFFLGNELITLTDWNAPNCRVLAINLDRPEWHKSREVVPECHSMIHNIAVVGGLIFVRYVENLSTRIEIFNQAGGREGTLSPPFDGAPRFLAGRAEDDTLFYELTSFFHPPTILTYHTLSRKHSVWAEHETLLDPSSTEVRRVRYSSKDGTEIPMFLAWQRGRQSWPRPTFVTGYGGFGATIMPQFSVHATLLIEEGFLVAVVNLRGGSEFGREWHSAGKRHNRQNVIDDFISAVEWLVANGYTTPSKIAIGGGSNAGLLVGAALTQRPDLFRAVICLGPLLDMLRYHKFDSAGSWVEEFGSAENGQDFGTLLSYSPYHRVRNGTAYPAVLLITGDADTRCNPMHARKMAARLQATTISQHPILLDYRKQWGHMPVQPLTARINALTDRLAFLSHEVGTNL